MCLVVKFEGVVGVGEILLGLRLHFRVSLSPVKKFGAVAIVFGVSRFLCLERAVMPLLFLFHSCHAVPGEILCKIIAAGESCGVYNCPTNHNRDTRHGLLFYSKANFSIGGYDFLVHEVLFERNTARHDGSQFHVVHRTAAWVGGEVLFHRLFCDPADAGCEAG